MEFSRCFLFVTFIVLTVDQFRPMRKHQLVSRHVKFELVYISSLPKLITTTCRRISADEGTCRRDVSQRFVASCVSAFSDN